jgi:hypothetical protein
VNHPDDPPVGMSFFGLLYLSNDAGRHANLKQRRDAVVTYLLCAALCARTIHAAGGNFTLLTNRKDKIAAALAEQGIEWVAVEEMVFALDVPEGIPFYEAHFKLDVLSALGRGAFGEHAGLIDIDALFLRPFRQGLASSSLEVYDISEQVFPAYGKDRVVSDLQRVAGQRLENPRWYGGEYIRGSRNQFATLAEYVRQCWPRYRNAIGKLHHLGDEMVTSAAISLARQDGMEVADMGACGEVARWWSAPIQHRQMPFHAAADSAYLHLPSDKVFLAQHATPVFRPDLFVREFRAYARRKILFRRIQNAVDPVLGRPRKDLPEL